MLFRSTRGWIGDRTPKCHYRSYKLTTCALRIKHFFEITTASSIRFLDLSFTSGDHGDGMRIALVRHRSDT